jgi:hypothetical protein
METIYNIIGILICILLLLIIVLYLVFAYQIYRLKKRSDKFVKDKGLEIINKKIDKLIK